MPKIDIINQCLADELTDIERVSFFICPIDDGGTLDSPLALLKKEKINDMDLFRIKRAANLMYNQIAK